MPAAALAAPAHDIRCVVQRRVAQTLMSTRKVESPPPPLVIVGDRMALSIPLSLWDSSRVQCVRLEAEEGDRREIEAEEAVGS